MIRKIVNIDEEKCNGCGLCANACHEGAIELIDGKAHLIKDDYCDGFGDCLPECPTGAITITQREAAAYDEDAVKARMAAAADESDAAASQTAKEQPVQSELQNWPVQIKLAPVRAPYFENAKLLIAADCTAYAYARFHQDFIRNHVVLIGCPKLDDIDYTEKLQAIIENNNIKSVEIVRMEVPCCGGLQYAASNARKNSGKFIPWNVVTIGIDGRILDKKSENQENSGDSSSRISLKAICR